MRRRFKVDDLLHVTPAAVPLPGTGAMEALVGSLETRMRVISGTPEPGSSYDHLFALLQAAAGEVPEAAKDAVKNLAWLAVAPAEPDPPTRQGPAPGPSRTKWAPSTCRSSSGWDNSHWRTSHLKHAAQLGKGALTPRPNRADRQAE